MKKRNAGVNMKLFGRVQISGGDGVMMMTPDHMIGGNLLISTSLTRGLQRRESIGRLKRWMALLDTLHSII